MTPLPPTALVAAADYADALITARRVKTTLCTALFFVLGTQLTLFLMLRYTASLRSITDGAVGVAAGQWRADVFRYLIGLMDFAGLIVPAVLVGAVAVILLVQIAARAVGAGRTTSAAVWAILLLLLMFPWQAVLNNPAISGDPTANAIGMKVPGAVYTWAEVSHPTQGARFAELNTPVASTDRAVDVKLVALLHWLRYAGFPVVCMVIVGLIHTKTERALRQSFGSAAAAVDDPDVAVVTDPRL